MAFVHQDQGEELWRQEAGVGDRRRIPHEGRAASGEGGPFVERLAEGLLASKTTLFTGSIRLWLRLVTL